MNFKEKTKKIRNKIFTGDSLEILKTFPDESVDIVVSSPPYFNLRYYPNAYTIKGGDKNCNHEWTNKPTHIMNSDGGRNSSKLATKETSNFQSFNEHKKVIDNGYSEKSKLMGGKGVNPKHKNQKREYDYYICKKCGAIKFQLGLENTVDDYAHNLCDILDEVKRVLKKTGSLFLNIGDTYDSKTGQLLLVPYRIALEMQKRGWIIRSDIRWVKKILYYNKEQNAWDTMGNGLPESQSSRFVKNNETIIFATKIKTGYFFQWDGLKLGLKQESIERFQRNSTGGKYNLLDSKQEFGINNMIKYKDKMKKEYNGKYKNEDEQLFGSMRAREVRKHSNRAGLNRDMDKEILRRNLPNRKEFVYWLKNTLKEKGIKKEFLNYFGETKASHWLRSDDSGFSFPSYGEWLSIKQFLGLEETPFDEQMENLIEDTQDLKLGFKRAPNNWLVNPKGVSIAHFAVMPPDLVYLCLVHGTPQYVCANCGKPYKKKYKYVENKNIDWKYYGANENGKYNGKSVKEHEKHNKQDSSEMKKRILEGMKVSKIEAGYEKDCNCQTNEKIKPLVLDPFVGIGTVLIKAKEILFDYVGIEINPDYVKIAEKQLRELGEFLF